MDTTNKQDTCWTVAAICLIVAINLGLDLDEAARLANCTSAALDEYIESGMSLDNFLFANGLTEKGLEILHSLRKE